VTLACLLQRFVPQVHDLFRQNGNLNGTVMDYEIHVSLDGVTWGAPWFTGSWVAIADEKTLIESHGRQGRYVKLVAKSELRGRPWTSAAFVSASPN
jgi:alpha-glucosidase